MLSRGGPLWRSMFKATRRSTARFSARIGGAPDRPLAKFVQVQDPMLLIFDAPVHGTALQTDLDPRKSIRSMRHSCWFGRR